MRSVTINKKIESTKIFKKGNDFNEITLRNALLFVMDILAENIKKNH